MGNSRKEDIRKQCGIVVLVGIFVMASLYLRFEPGWQLAKFMVLVVLLLTIAIIDAKWLVIPDSLLLFGLLFYILGALWSGMTAKDLFFSILLGGCAVAVPLYCFVLLADRLLQRETMGGGDLKLFFVLGVYLGPALTILTLFFACLVGIGISLYQRAERGQLLPFGPSIALAAWFVVLWGEQLLQWYGGIV